MRGRSGGGAHGSPNDGGNNPWIDWRLARKQKERAVEAAGHTDATAGKKLMTETPGSGSRKGTGEAASLRASGSSGDEWSRAEN